MNERKPFWPVHDEDGVWYCDAHGTWDCRRCSRECLERTVPALVEACKVGLDFASAYGSVADVAQIRAALDAAGVKL